MTIRAALYAYAKDARLNGQILTVGHHADEKDIHISGTYTDTGQFQYLKNRPGFQRMLEDASQGLIDRLLVETAEVLSCDKFELAWYRRKLRAAGVSLTFVNGDSIETPKEMILESLLEGMLEYLDKRQDIRLFEVWQSDGSDAL